MIPKRSDKAAVYLKIWLYSGAVLIFLMVVVGGVTRLTGSGLSITEWNVIMGTVPPVNQAEWNEAFDQYKQFPEYRQVNKGMSLADFKAIYFWEYLHRLIGRILALAFIVPFAWFWIKGFFDRMMFKRLSILFVLGISQGLAGWLMVKSGLVDVPYVSHYRLALHLVLAFILFGYCIWLALDIKNGREERIYALKPANRVLLYAIGILIGLQVIWGAFVAGLKAGYIYNTFPLMNGEWLPQNACVMDAGWLGFIELPGMVQWTHRVLGTLLVVATILFWVRLLFMSIERRVMIKTQWLLAGILVQFLLGVATLIYNVPIVLGIMHQAMALVVLGIWIFVVHECKNKNNAYI